MRKDPIEPNPNHQAKTDKAPQDKVPKDKAPQDKIPEDKKDKTEPSPKAQKDLPTLLIKKTGQTKSYNQSGDEVTDGRIKDDGYYQKGVAPSYTRDDAKEIVTDNITSWQWQDDSEAKTVKKNWNDAKTYCTNLRLGGYNDWRLPNMNQLESLIDYGRGDPSIDPTFRNVRGSFYSSSNGFVDDLSAF